MNFYDSIIEAAQELPAIERGQLYTAVLEYLDERLRREPDLARMRPAPKAIFIAMRPVLDNQVERSATGKANGRKGGRPRKATANQEPKKPETGNPDHNQNETQTITQTETKTETQAKANQEPKLFDMPPETGNPDGTQTKGEQEQEQDIEKPLTSVSGKKRPKPRKPFVPPSVGDVARAARERNLTLVDPEEFWAHYDAQGWLLGNGNPMVNWESKLISWNSERRQRQQEQGGYDATYD